MFHLRRYPSTNNKKKKNNNSNNSIDYRRRISDSQGYCRKDSEDGKDLRWASLSRGCVLNARYFIFCFRIMGIESDSVYKCGRTSKCPSENTTNKQYCWGFLFAPILIFIHLKISSFFCINQMSFLLVSFPSMVLSDFHISLSWKLQTFHL